MRLTDIPLDPSMYDRIYGPEVQALVMLGHHSARWGNQELHTKHNLRRTMLRERVEEYRYATHRHPA